MDCVHFLCMCVPDSTRSRIRLQQRVSGLRRNSAQPCCVFILESGNLSSRVFVLTFGQHKTYMQPRVGAIPCKACGILDATCPEWTWPASPAPVVQRARLQSP